MYLTNPSEQFMQVIKPILKLLFFLCLYSCNTIYRSEKVQYKDYQINRSRPVNASLNAMLQPYADSVNRSMNNVVAVSEVTLDRRQPEGSLGNLVADAMLTKAREKYVQNVDIAVMNSGGIRLPTIAAGEITRGKIFELSPFDNIIVLQKLTGTQLQEFMDHVASKGGWPVSGMSYQLKNKKAINIRIGNMPLDERMNYTMALLDYVANGGDDAAMLRKIPQINHGFLFRDALIEYFSDINRSGHKISAKIENRVSYAN